MRRMLLIVSAVGVLLFGSLLVVSLAKPEWIEASARTLLRAEIERRVGAEIAFAQDGRIAGAAHRALAQWPSERTSAVLPTLVATALAEMRDGDCACRAGIGRRVQDVAGERLGKLSTGSGHLKQSVRAAYVDTAGKLHRELRIFAGSNTGVFLLLGVVVWWRDARSVLLPALVLIGGAALTGGLYLFGQNWLHTIVFDSYVGYGYIVWLGLAVGFLADIAFNRGRVTQCITNGIGSALPS
ncbi:hypothetical protein LU699_12505 [Luteimonas fraxinea]|uniref:Uncharacterized protein n=1 Tax=Luteimonas fraxinea TaxID=2901869 RepID=A0ABS8UHR1_9GAMM|nr:hypothetical protein [Luteimonas fraxinea]MCD9098829.1 hypothetical protein [Luteimonas fraxinea]UHH09113.1 hypothetical protein LU699_12505 [Luteimonas fraxinea]